MLYAVVWCLCVPGWCHMHLCVVCVSLVGVVFVWCMSVPGWYMCLCGPAREGMCAWGRSEADVGIFSSVISFTFVRQVFNH